MSQGAGATAAFFITSVAKMTGFGSLLVIALSYAIGVVIVSSVAVCSANVRLTGPLKLHQAITVCGPASGGHLSPCFTIAFWLLRGFPGKKVPFYIVAQIFGAFVGREFPWRLRWRRCRPMADHSPPVITVYGIYK